MRITLRGRAVGVERLAARLTDLGEGNHHEPIPTLRRAVKALRKYDWKAVAGIDDLSVVLVDEDHTDLAKCVREGVPAAALRTLLSIA